MALAKLCAIVSLAALVVTACGESVSPYYAGGDVTVQITSAGLERQFMVHVPPSLSPRLPAPLLLVLHGSGGDGPGTQRYTEVDVPADRAGFIIVYPEASEGGFWAVGGQSLVDLSGVDDLAFVGDVLDFVTAELNIDPTRIYVAGFSNGALLAHRLACTMGDRFVGMASVAMTMLDSIAASCNPGVPMPAIFFNGTLDPTWGGPTTPWYTLLSAERTVEVWAELNGCELTSDVTALPDIFANDSTTVERRYYSRCPSGADVLFYVVMGGGHNWPGSPFDIPLLGCTTRDVSASQLIVDFFSGGAAAALATPPPAAADSGKDCDRLFR